MARKIAAFGDVHGRLECLEELYAKLSWLSLDAIYHLGDLVDRGPHPLEVVQFCMEFGIDGVVGNHEGALLAHYFNPGIEPKNPDKLRTYRELNRDPRTIQWLRERPYSIVEPDCNALLVHGGLWPWKPFYEQGQNLAFQGMAHPDHPGKSRWYDKDRRGKSEAELRAEGWVRWYEAYDGTLDVVAGHAVLGTPCTQPFTYRCPGGATYYAVDTGAHFTGVLTAVVMQGPDRRHFVSTDCGAIPGQFTTQPD